MRNALVAALVPLLLAISWHRDPVIGVWDLDVAQSSFSPGPALKSQTRVYEQTRAGVKFTLTGVSGAGNPMRVEYTAPYDGKDYPLSGSLLGADKVSLKRVDARTTERIDKKDGKTVMTLKRVVSRDGKTMTVTAKGTNAEGKPVNNVVVFEKQ